MKAQWLNHLRDPEEKKKFKQYVLNSGPVFDRLHQIITQMQKEQKRDDYREAGWPYLRAYDDGYNQALKEVMTIITIKEN